MKQYVWTVTVQTAPASDLSDGFLWPEEHTASTPEASATEDIAQSCEQTYRITYTFSRLRGRMTVSIDGETFSLPAGFLGCKAARREIFRLGDEQAILSVDGAGKPSLLVHGETMPPDMA